MEKVKIEVKGKKWCLSVTTAICAVMGAIGMVLGLVESHGNMLGGLVGVVAGLVFAAIIRFVLR